jgi:polyphosphate kinase
LNCIDHLLKQFPYRDIEKPQVVLPDRERRKDYSRRPVPQEMLVPEVY